MLSPIIVAILVSSSPGVQQAPPPQQPSMQTQAVTEQPWPPAGVYQKSDGVVMPRLLKERKPMYTADAFNAGVEGGVLLEAVVKTDGTVGEVRVKRSIDKVYGLDDEAVKAVKQWRFEPGKKDGQAVPVLVEIELTFARR